MNRPLFYSALRVGRNSISGILRWTTFAGSFAGSFVCACVFLLTAAQAVEAARPNIVLILADDLGYSDLGCFGGEIQTPNLDRLARDGVRMTQFYNTGKCHTSRASLLTGLDWQQAMLPGKYTLGDSGPTIAEALKDAGYLTAISGKWHLSNSAESDQSPLSRGFDRFFGTIKGAGSFFDPESLCRDRMRIEPEDEFYYTDAITSEAVHSIRIASAAHQPLFLYVAYTAPHWPLHARTEDIAKYDGVYEKGWDVIRKARHEKMKSIGIVPDHWKLSEREGEQAWDAIPNQKWHERRMEVYAAMVDRMDQGIGRIVGALAASGQLSNTLLMFLSDNGACSVDVDGRLAASCLGNQLTTRDGLPITTGPVPGIMPGPETTFQAYGTTWANVSNTPYRKYKSSSYEGGIRTPFILHWPDGIKPSGKVVDQPAHLIDVMPTCLEVAGAEYPAEFDGKPLPRLMGISLTRDSTADVASRTLYQQFRSGAALFQGKWKIVSTNFESGRWQMHDMDADGTELDDVSAMYPERFAELIKTWQEWADRVTVRP